MGANDGGNGRSSTARSRRRGRSTRGSAHDGAGDGTGNGKGEGEGESESDGDGEEDLSRFSQYANSHTVRTMLLHTINYFAELQAKWTADRPVCEKVMARIRWHREKREEQFRLIFPGHHTQRASHGEREQEIQCADDVDGDKETEHIRDREEGEGPTPAAAADLGANGDAYTEEAGVKPVLTVEDIGDGEFVMEETLDNSKNHGSNDNNVGTCTDDATSSRLGAEAGDDEGRISDQSIGHRKHAASTHSSTSMDFALEAGEKIVLNNDSFLNSSMEDGELNTSHGGHEDVFWSEMKRQKDSINSVFV